MKMGLRILLATFRSQILTRKTSPFTKVTRPVQMIGSLLIFASSLGLMVWSAWFFISTINIGPELSDSVFYILMRAEYTDNHYMFSGFGVLLATFAGEAASLQTIRLYAILTMLIIPALFLVTICREPLRDGSPWLLAAGILVSSCANLAYYKWLLLDPSYNSLVLTMTYPCALSLWLIWGEVYRKESMRAWILATWAFVLGAGIFYLSWIKISSGALFVLVFMPVFTLTMLVSEGCLNRRGLAATLGVFALLVLGAVAAFALVSARTLPPGELWARFHAGFTGMVLLEGHITTIAPHFSALGVALSHLLNLLWAHPVSLILPLLCLAAVQMRIGASFFIFSMLLGVFTLFPLIFLVVTHLQDFTRLAQITWIFALALSFLVLFEARKSPRHVLFVTLFAWAPYWLSFGTSSDIAPHATIFSGAAVTAIFLAGMTLARLRSLLVLCAVILGAGVTLGAIDQASRFPYRMDAPLSEATQYFHVQGERWRVTPPLAGSYQAVEEIRATSQWREARKDGQPVLLDMSGRAPALNWLGDFRIPATPWTLGGYPGSDALLAWALDRVNEQDLRKMWIAVDDPSADGMRSGLSIEKLNARLENIGLAFPQDYTQVGGAIPLAYVKRTARLYAPKVLSD